MIPIHLLGIFWFVGLYYGPALNYILYIPIFWFCISCLGIAIGYHRLLSHRAFKTHPWVMRILSFLGLLGGQGSPIFWAAVHRSLHHPHSDKEKDAHSPQRGWFHSYMGWQFFFNKKRVNPRHTIDLIRDPYIRTMSHHYYLVYWMTVGLLYLMFPNLVLYTLIPATLVSIHQENLINVFGHSTAFGYRNFETNDYSTNNIILGWLFFGQGFHNNHHQYPQSYDFGYHWWEFDICSLIVPLLSTEKTEKKSKIKVYEKSVDFKL